MHRLLNMVLLAIVAVGLIVSCSGKPIPVLKVVDTENNRLVVLAGERTKPVNFYDADFVILGGGLGGIAAALSICSAGRTVILVEESDRIAGCFTYQDTSVYSENRFVETSGTSRSYQEFRENIRQWYKDNDQTPPSFFPRRFPGMKDFAGDNFCFETEAALDVIDEMLAKNIERGKLTVISRHKVAKVVTFSTRIASLHAVDMDSLVCNQITGWMIVDATRNGYILPLSGIDYVCGMESARDTGEPHAADSPDSLFSGHYLYCSYAPPSEDGGDYQECFVGEMQQGVPRDTTGVVMVPLGPRPRRIVSKKRIVEQDISAESNPGPRAAFFRDSVGIGYHPIVLPPRMAPPGKEIIRTKPFQIPLGALIPRRFTNYIAGGRTIGATFVASRAYNAPSVEWQIGEAAGEVAAYCAGYGIFTHEVLESPEHVRGLQDWLVTKRGVPIYWYDDLTPYDPEFNSAQMKPFDESGYHESMTTLHFRQK